jgi:hypothetical protein
MLERVLQMLSIRCSHKRTSQPFTAARNPTPAAGGAWETVGSGPSHYVVCLDCGKKFAYDWANMRMLRH